MSFGESFSYSFTMVFFVRDITKKSTSISIPSPFSMFVVIRVPSDAIQEITLKWYQVQSIFLLHLLLPLKLVNSIQFSIWFFFKKKPECGLSILPRVISDERRDEAFEESGVAFVDVRWVNLQIVVLVNNWKNNKSEKMYYSILTQSFMYNLITTEIKRDIDRFYNR